VVVVVVVVVVVAAVAWRGACLHLFFKVLTFTSRPDSLGIYIYICSSRAKSRKPGSFILCAFVLFSSHLDCEVSHLVCPSVWKRNLRIETRRCGWVGDHHLADVCGMYFWCVWWCPWNQRLQAVVGLGV
jgi:hypothetical protein